MIKESQEAESIFNRSGLAALSDVQKKTWKQVFLRLESEQKEFLSKTNKILSPEYKWPRDPLHCWSRIWEYPYVYYQLNRYANAMIGENRKIVADIGSGVTFFPFSLAKLGYEVICTDIDPICEKDIPKACRFVSHSPGRVSFRMINDKMLPFHNEECDTIYCISVLEHISNFGNTIREISRVLKPGGLCLITCDLCLEPKSVTQLDIYSYKKLLKIIGQQFDFIFPEKTIHPLDLLTNQNSPYSNRSNSYMRFGYQLIKQRMIKPLVRKKPGYVNLLGSPLLTIVGMVFEKRK